MVIPFVQTAAFPSAGRGTKNTCIHMISQRMTQENRCVHGTPSLSPIPQQPVFIIKWSIKREKLIENYTINKLTEMTQAATSSFTLVITCTAPSQKPALNFQVSPLTITLQRTETDWEVCYQAVSQKWHKTATPSLTLVITCKFKDQLWISKCSFLTYHSKRQKRDWIMLPRNLRETIKDSHTQSRYRHFLYSTKSWIMSFKLSSFLTASRRGQSLKIVLL